jgi:hypothetical protein
MGSCYASNLRPESSIEEQRIFVIVTIVIDLVQNAYISIMPIPWTSTMVFCLAEAVVQCLRIRICFGAGSYQFETARFGLREGASEIKMIRMVLLLSVFSVNFMSMITANINGRSLRETDQNILLSKNSVQQKQSLIQCYCSDITVSLQNVIEVVSVLKCDMMEGPESDGLADPSDKDADIAKCMVMVLNSIDYESVLINELLLLARIEEGRFSYHCHDVVVLLDLIDNLMHLEFGGANWAYRGKLRIDLSPEVAAIRTNKFCLSVLLRHFLSMALMHIKAVSKDGHGAGDEPEDGNSDGDDVDSYLTLRCSMLTKTILPSVVSTASPTSHPSSLRSSPSFASSSTQSQWSQMQSQQNEQQQQTPTEEAERTLQVVLTVDRNHTGLRNGNRKKEQSTNSSTTTTTSSSTNTKDSHAHVGNLSNVSN